MSIPGSSKYGGQGNGKTDMFRGDKLPGHVKKKLASWVNHGKANGTWSSYRTAEKMVMLCQKETGSKFDWPMTSEDTLLLVYYLVENRQLKVATVNSYLSGVRQLHVMKGLEPPKLRSELVKQALRGRANLETSERRNGKASSQDRLPMTIALMKLLKEKIHTSELGREDKLMLWTVSSLLFFGAFRISEIASKHESTFDPDHTLLTEDVKLTKMGGSEILTVRLKCPKEKRSGDPTVVDIFESGGGLCPIKAFKKWKVKAVLTEKLPLFRHSNGTPLTGRKFNEYLRQMLGKHASFAQGTISAHSFRAGVTTILGAKGFSEEEIKLVGRWSSRAFTIYMKGQRTQRAVIAKQLGKIA